ncbi:uncharacterized protein LOC126676779 [Mercurialis annua]|uniref:uncharacterized protein LOC126676779 n=1 Tax=Mercurialis annua TaxID=3986 RepID=UPI00215FC6FF|nr:uncharacterized protein LOC126676779 [Mercurialis annua]
MDPPPPQPPFFQLPTATITGAAVHSVAPQTQIFPTFPSLPEQLAPEAAAGAAAAHNHTAYAATATDPTAAQSLNHPPYADMIYGAITALKERDGSSKRAIAKYIESVYTGLPETHSALLTHHLKQLKNNGYLVMVKNSYALPRSAETVTVNNSDTNISPAALPNLNPNPNPNPNPTAGVAGSPTVGSKRGRGRPPKPKSTEPNNAPAAPVTVPVGLSISPSEAIISAVVSPQSQEGDKRRPGRPKKVSPVGGGGAPVAVRPRGRPPKSGPFGVKRSPGRPRKLKSVASNGVKRGPKRLPKSVVVPYANSVAAAAVVSPRPRGRPKKGTGGAAPAAAAPAASGYVGAGVVQGKRPGRPPKAAVGAGVFSHKKRPGRPKKNANVSWGATEPSQQQSEAYGDLKMKFDFFQSKVMQAVGVLRPQLTNETPVSVVAAIQELEGLASMDINAPLREEAPPAQPPQL